MEGDKDLRLITTHIDKYLYIFTYIGNAPPGAADHEADQGAHRRRRPLGQAAEPLQGNKKLTSKSIKTSEFDFLIQVKIVPCIWAKSVITPSK